MNTSILEVNRMPIGFVRVAGSFTERFKGLMLKDQESAEHLMAIAPCKQVHTFFMKFPIDVAYCDKQGTVIEIHRNIEPWHVDKSVSSAYIAIEAPAGTYLKEVSKGDVIYF